MEKTKNLIEWIAKRLFPISIVIFILIYLWWFRLTPWNPSMSIWDPPKVCCINNSHYRFGLALFIFYIVSGTFWWLVKKRGCLETFFRVTMIFFFILNSSFTAVFLPRIIDTAKYRGIVYYLVYYSNWPEHTPWEYYQLTKWQGVFRYDTHGVSGGGGLEIRYDEKMQLVSVVKVFPTNYERLVYSDSVPPRVYDYGYGVDVEFEGKRYYVSYQCNRDPKYSYLCESYTNMLYQCELDNTSCIPLLFKYTGDPAFGLYVENGGAVNSINVFFDIGRFPGKKTLIYTFGKHSYCYVEGCEILEGAK